MNEVHFYPQLWSANIDFSLDAGTDRYIDAHLSGIILKSPWGQCEGLMNEETHKALKPVRTYAIGDSSDKEMSFLSIQTHSYEQGARYWIFNMKDLEGDGFWIPFDEPQRRLNAKEPVNLETLIDLKMRRARLIPQKAIEYLRDKAQKKGRTAKIRLARHPIEDDG